MLNKLALLLLKPDVFCFIYKEDHTKLANYWDEITKSVSPYNIKSYLNCIVPSEYKTDFWNCLSDFYLVDMRDYDCALEAINQLILDNPTGFEELKYRIKRVNIIIEKYDYEQAISESLSVIEKFIEFENNNKLDADSHAQLILEHFTILHHLFIICVDTKQIDLADSILGNASDYLEEQKECIPEEEYFRMLYTFTSDLGLLFQKQGDLLADNNDSQKELYYEKGIESFSMACGLVKHKFDFTSNTSQMLESLYYNVGVLYAKLKDFKAACDAFSTANNLSLIVSNSECLRSLAISYFNLALCESDLGELEKAIVSFQNSISYAQICKEKDPNFLPCHSLKCRYYITKHKHTLNQITNNVFFRLPKSVSDRMSKIIVRV